MLPIYLGILNRVVKQLVRMAKDQTKRNRAQTSFSQVRLLDPHARLQAKCLDVNSLLIEEDQDQGSILTLVEHTIYTFS